MADRNTPSKRSGSKKQAARGPRRRGDGSQPAQRGSFCPIVGIGASAGGLEALEDFFRHTPSDSGMAFVVVTHQHPGHKSLLPEILSKSTSLDVVEARNALSVEPNGVYVGPPGAQLQIVNGVLELMSGPANQDVHLPIDCFFRSLAQDMGPRAIGVILSGTGTDGTLGLKAIKGESGMAMVQEAKSARYAGMPESAIAAGVADYVLPPDKMAEQLLAYIRGAYIAQPPAVVEEGGAPAEAGLPRIFGLLRVRTGHDFSGYKQGTLRRRIERRMNVHQISETREYVRYLQENPQEVDLLFKELLISVTSFFRDSEAFDELRKTAVPHLFELRPTAQALRVWVPACATGEEAYSIAIVLREYLDEIDERFEVQIFATDLDSEAIETARFGRYPEGIAADVSPERLNRFFTRDDNTYRIKKEIREMVVFAVQDVIKDPPFTRLNLICCRNLLIYLNTDIQQQLLSVFHYALRPGGQLFLGPSETVGGSGQLFTAMSKKWKIFRRKETGPGAHPVVPLQMRWRHDLDRIEATERVGVKESRVSAIVEKLLFERFVPPTVLVNDNADVVYIHGRTGAWLEPPSGPPRFNILDMAREGLRIELASVLRQAAVKDEEIVHQGVRVRSNGDFVLVDVSVKRIRKPEAIRGLLMVTLTPTAASGARKKAGPARRRTPPTAELERELQYAKENLQTTIEELETSNEELRSTNEELQSTNEELQSANEELETSREEMQSLNEELTTVNSELQSKVDELSQANNDMQNLLNSTEIATVFLDNNLKVRRFTTRAQSIIRLIQTDVGRPIKDLASNLQYSPLIEDAQQVLATLVSKEAEVRTTEGEWFLMRMMPYRTVENVIDGVVITFVDINRTKRAEALRDATEDAKRFFESILQAVRNPLVVLDESLQVVLANQSFYYTFRVSPEETVGRLIFELGNRQWNISELRQALQGVLNDGQPCNDFEVDHVFPDIGRKVMLVNAHAVRRNADMPGLILLAIDDVTGRAQ